MEVGREIRRRREANGWSQAKLAGLTGMGVSGVSQIETGARNPSAVTLGKLAEALGVEVGDLYRKKVQAPLFEEDERRRSPFVEAWTSYVLLRSEKWEEDLPEGNEELLTDLERAVRAFQLNELVQVETAMLCKALLGALVETLLIENGSLMAPRYAAFGRDLTELLDKRADLRAASDAAERMYGIADRWRAHAGVAGEVVEAQISRNQFENARRARDGGERAFEERRDELASFEQRRSA